MSWNDNINFNVFVLNLDHSLHCHHPDDDSIHLHKGESQTLKGTCILLTCLDHVTDTFKETRYKIV